MPDGNESRQVDELAIRLARIQAFARIKLDVQHHASAAAWRTWMATVVRMAAGAELASGTGPANGRPIRGHAISGCPVSGGDCGMTHDPEPATELDAAIEDVRWALESADSGTGWQDALRVIEDHTEQLRDRVADLETELAAHRQWAAEDKATIEELRRLASAVTAMFSPSNLPDQTFNAVAEGPAVEISTTAVEALYYLRAALSEGGSS